MLLQGSGLKLHPGHVTIGGSSSEEEEEEERQSGLEKVQVPLVEREERELGSLSTPRYSQRQPMTEIWRNPSCRLLVQSLGPLPCPSVNVSLVGTWAQSLAAEAITLIQVSLWRCQLVMLRFLSITVKRVVGLPATYFILNLKTSL